MKSGTVAPTAPVKERKPQLVRSNSLKKILDGLKRTNTFIQLHEVYEKRKEEISQAQRDGLLLLLVVCMLLVCAAVMHKLEGDAERRHCESRYTQMESLLSALEVSNLSADQQAVNIELITTEMKQCNPALPDWTFNGACYFWFTVMSTIGYGTFTPKTMAGRLFTALTCIPSIVLYMQLVLRVAEGYIVPALVRCHAWLRAKCPKCFTKVEVALEKADSPQNQLMDDIDEDDTSPFSKSIIQVNRDSHKLSRQSQVNRDSHRRVSFDKEDYKNSDLVKLSGQGQSELELIDSFYLIQQEILFHKLIIKSIDQTRSGNIKVFLKGGQEIRFQQHKLEDQLSRLNLFLISSESKKLINNFKSIDLRYKTKIAINYF